MTKAAPSDSHSSHQQVRHGRSVPIGDYGFLSDGEVSALVAPGGSIDWMCIPRFDSPSTFGYILGKLAGSFRVAPDEVTVPGDRRYLPGTMILETSWGTTTGWIIVRDALLIGPWPRRESSSSCAPLSRFLKARSAFF